MREHPIPQDVTGYQFHLIGEMTIKQFAEVLAGVLLAFIFYKTNLPIFLKYPLVLLFGGGGFLIAFVPYEERPLDVWLITFIKSLYKPTKFYWKKDNKIPDAFTYKQTSDIETVETEIDLSPLRKQKIHEFISSLNTKQKGLDDWDLAQQEQVGRILNNFDQVVVPDTINLEIQEKTQIKKPDLKVRVRKLQNSQTQIKPQQVIFEKPQPQAQLPVQPQQVQQQNYQSQTQTPQEELHQTPSLTQPPTAQPLTEQAISKADLPFPNKPAQPNKIVGMVVDEHNSLIGGAIIEIKTETGQVLRAVKSNSLGQFFVSTALDNGKYLLETEKQGLKFPIYHLELTGKVLDPLEIRAETH